MNTAEKQGAVGIICCRFIDANGVGLGAAPEDRLIAANLKSLRNARKKLLVVCGNDWADATLAAIRGGLVTHLCVDDALARQLLEAPGV